MDSVQVLVLVPVLVLVLDSVQVLFLVPVPVLILVLDSVHDLVLVLVPVLILVPVLVLCSHPRWSFCPSLLSDDDIIFEDFARQRLTGAQDDKEEDEEPAESPKLDQR